MRTYARGRMGLRPSTLGVAQFHETHTLGTKVADDSTYANKKGCHVCGARPILRLVQRRGYCRDHVSEAFADALASFEPMKFRGNR